MQSTTPNGVSGRIIKCLEVYAERTLHLTYFVKKLYAFILMSQILRQNVIELQ